MRFVHSKHSSIYEAAEAWLDSFNDPSDHYHSSDSEDASVESCLGSDYFCDSRPVRDTKSSRPHAGDEATARVHNSRRRPQVLTVVKKGVIDRRMSGDYRSGCRGVSWNRRMKAWLAFWMDGKTRRSKTFSSKVFGFEEARLAAIEFLQGRKRESGGDITLFSIDTSPPLTPKQEQDIAFSDGNVSSKSSGGSTAASRSGSHTNSPIDRMLSLSSVSTGVVAIMSG